MATVADTFAWSTDKADVKAYLGISVETEDTRLGQWYDGAVAECDRYLLSRDFNSMPGLIWIGICEYVRAMRHFWNRPPGAIQIKTGQLGEMYPFAGNSAAQYAKNEAVGFWRPYRQRPDLGQ